MTVLQTGQAFLTSILADRLFGTTGVIIGFVLNVVVFFVLAESMPKTWAVLHTERAGLLTARFTQLLVSFPPLRLISRGLIGLTNVLLPGKGLKQGPFVSEQELLGIVEAAAEDEVIEHEERELIESIIEFGDTVAREVMVPRPDMIVVPHDATVTAALDLAIAHGVSRLPLHGEDDEDIVGLIYTKDLIRAEREGRGDTPALDLARPVRFIPENKPVTRLMREMQAGKFHLAIVADEYGGIVGLITLEDCLEELVGEIVDEYDIEELAVQRLPNGDYLVDGGVQVEDLNELLDAHLPDEEWDTRRRLPVRHARARAGAGRVRRARRLALRRRGDRRASHPPGAGHAAAPAATSVPATATTPRSRRARSAIARLPSRRWRSHWRARSRSSPARRRASAGRSPPGSPASGAKVMLSSRKQEQLEAAAAEIDGETAVFAANAGDLDAAAACVDATIETFGGLDILVNNAATNPYFGATLGVDPGRYDKTFEVNVRGPLFWSQAGVGALVPGAARA